MTRILFHELSEPVFVVAMDRIDANNVSPGTWLWNGNVGVWASIRYSAKANRWHWHINNDPPKNFKLQLLLLGV